MTDICKMKQTTAIQYSLEKFLEVYNDAETESDRLFVLYQMLDYVEDNSDSIDKIKFYLQLQPEKFEPFVKLISKVDILTDNAKARSTKNKSTPVTVSVYTFSE